MPETESFGTVLCAIGQVDTEIPIIGGQQQIREMLDTSTLFLDLWLIPLLPTISSW